MVEKLTDSCTYSWKFLHRDFFFWATSRQRLWVGIWLEEWMSQVAEKVTNNFKKSWKCLDKHYGSAIQLEGWWISQWWLEEVSEQGLWVIWLAG